MGAAGVHAASGGEGEFLVDGVYLVDGNWLETLAGPEDNLYGPTISTGGTVAAIRPRAGFWRLPPGDDAWVHDPRLSDASLSSLSWATTGDAFAVLDSNTRSARLVRFGADGGERIIGRVDRASAVLVAPGAQLLATRPAVRVPVRREPGCGQAYMVGLDGVDRVTVAAGWSPLAWSADSSALLVSRGREIGVWSLDGRFLARTDVGVRTWMAAPIYPTPIYPTPIDNTRP